MIGVLLMGIKPSRSNQLMVEGDESAFTKGFLERIIKHLLVFLALNVIFIGQLEKDIGLRQLTNKYHIRCEEDQ